jgi:hypothetical protein
MVVVDDRAWIHVFLSAEGSLSKKLKETADPDLLLNHPTQKVMYLNHRTIVY